MARLKFEMFLDDFCRKERGICTTFTDGKGRKSTTWWSSPPESIDHVDISYLRGRFGNGLTKHHEKFIKICFKKEMKRFEAIKGSRYKLIS